MAYRRKSNAGKRPAKGARSKMSYKYCPHCGKEISGDGFDKKPAPRKSRSLHDMKWIPIMILVIFAIIILTRGGAL